MKGGHAIGRQWTRPILRGVKASTFLLAVLIVSSVVVVQSPRPSKAEGLLYTVTCTVGSLLQRNCPTKPVEPTPTQNPSAPSTTPTPAPTQPQSSEQAPPETDTFTPVSEAPAPLELDETMPGNLAAITPVSRTSSRGYQYPAHVWMSFSNSPANEAVLGEASEAPYLEATDQGWRFLGMLWYWWVIVIGAFVSLAALIKTTVTNSFFNIVR